MPLKITTVDAFRAAAKAGATPDAGVMHTLAGAPASIDEIAREIRYVFSDGSLDLAGDMIEPKGWELDQFNRNPVALWAHMSCDPPIGAAKNVAVAGGKLMGTIGFATAEEYGFADTIYRLAKGGYINAVSVGFVPLEWSFTNDKERPYGIDFTRQTLLEISLCPVPCNGNALQEARAAGIDTGQVAEWAQRVLDGEGSILVPRQFLEETFRAAKTPRAIRQKYLSSEKAETSDWRIGGAGDLPIDVVDDWDGAAAAGRIFAAAGFDGGTPDAEMARRGFLIYDSANPALKASYKLPFADIIDGELKAVDAGLRSAAARLPQTDAPQNVVHQARGVLDGYQKASVAAAAKAGRRISAASEAMLKKAMDHHQLATECIKSVLDNGGELEPDEDDSPVIIDAEDDQVVPKDAARERRLRKANALRIAASI